jgi:hypothetical protein
MLWCDDGHEPGCRQDSNLNAGRHLAVVSREEHAGSVNLLTVEESEQLTIEAETRTLIADASDLGLPPVYVLYPDESQATYYFLKDDMDPHGHDLLGWRYVSYAVLGEPLVSLVIANDWHAVARVRPRWRAGGRHLRAPGGRRSGMREGSTVRYQRRVVWTEGVEEVMAADSWDQAAELMAMAKRAAPPAEGDFGRRVQIAI